MFNREIGRKRGKQYGGLIDTGVQRIEHSGLGVECDEGRDREHGMVENRVGGRR